MKFNGRRILTSKVKPVLGQWEKKGKRKRKKNHEISIKHHIQKKFLKVDHRSNKMQKQKDFRKNDTETNHEKKSLICKTKQVVLK